MFWVNENAARYVSKNSIELLSEADEDNSRITNLLTSQSMIRFKVLYCHIPESLDAKAYSKRSVLCSQSRFSLKRSFCQNCIIYLRKNSSVSWTSTIVAPPLKSRETSSSHYGVLACMDGCLWTVPIFFWFLKFHPISNIPKPKFVSGYSELTLF